MESRHPAEWIMNFEISRRYPSVPWQSSYLQSILHSFSVFIFFTWFFCFLLFAFSASFSHSGANFWQWLHLNRGQIADRLADRHFRSLYISGQTECESHTSIMINHDQSCGFLELWLEQLQVCMWTQCGDTGLKCKTWKTQTSWNHTCKLHNWSCDQPAKKLMNVKSWPWQEQLT